ncbi:MAG: hypothetical protein DLM58_24335 [Pseudonocardiales bacterium]|nr:MAG: hypothetical protein DLM58_24335 [Pseudonocardiales bacterium]
MPIIEVMDAFYTLEELGGEDFDDWNIFGSGNAVVSASPLGQRVAIACGTEDGPLKVELQLIDAPPTRLATGWEDIAEVTIISRYGRDFVRIGGSGEPDPAFPRLRLAEGTYRLRVHVIGRDQARALGPIVESPVESQLLVVWPAPPAPPELLQATDTYGQILRRQLGTA